MTEPPKPTCYFQGMTVIQLWDALHVVHCQGERIMEGYYCKKCKVFMFKPKCKV